MGLFRNAKESPKTTKKGVITGIVTGVVMTVGTIIAANNETLGAIIDENQGQIITGIVTIVTAIVAYFANKKDS